MHYVTSSVRPLPLTVVIADPHHAFRRALSAVLLDHTDLAVVSEVPDLQSAKWAVRRHGAGALVLDVKLFAGGRGALGPLPAHTAIVVLGMNDGRAIARHVLAEGAHAYVVKDRAHALLAGAVLDAAAERGRRL